MQGSPLTCMSSRNAASLQGLGLSGIMRRDELLRPEPPLGPDIQKVCLDTPWGGVHPLEKNSGRTAQN